VRYRDVTIGFFVGYRQQQHKEMDKTASTDTVVTASAVTLSNQLRVSVLHCRHSNSSAHT
jgi:hypothetical protein